MILSDPFAPPPAPPVGRLRRGREQLVSIVLTPVAWVVGLVLIICIVIGGFGK